MFFPDDATTPQPVSLVPTSSERVGYRRKSNTGKMQADIQKNVSVFKAHARVDEATRNKFVSDSVAKLKELQRTQPKEYDQAISGFFSAIKQITSDKEGAAGTDIPATLVALDILLATRCMTPVQLSVCNNHVQFCLRYCDLNSAKTACAVFSKCIQQSQPNDVIRQLAYDALGWLQDNSPSKLLRRMTAVIMLKDLAVHMHVLLIPKLNEFFQNIWVTLADQNVEVRERAVDLFKGMMSVVQSRPPQTQAQLFSTLINKLQSLMGGKSADSVIGALSVFEPIFMSSMQVLESQYVPGWAMVWSLTSNQNLAIRLAAMSALRVLVRYDTQMFISCNLQAVVGFCLESTKKDTDRSAAFQLLSDVIKAVKSEAYKPFEDQTFYSIKMCLIQSKRESKVPIWEALACLATLCAVFPPSTNIESHVISCIGAVFSWGLTSRLIEHLKDVIRCCSPKFQTSLQERLLDIISKTLCGLPFRQTTNSGDSVPLASAGTTDPTQQTLVALEALVQFDFSNSELMGDFLRDSVVPFIDDNNPDIRRASINTVAQLLFPKDNLSVARRMVIESIIARLLNVAGSDSDLNTRLAVLNAFTPRFYPYLAQNHYLQSIFSCVADESPKVRCVAVTLLCHLLEHNPSHILPALRKILISILGTAEDDVAVNLQIIGAIADSAPTHAATFTSNIMTKFSPYVDRMSRRDDYTDPLLLCIGKLAIAAGEEFKPAVTIRTVQRILDLFSTLGYDKDVTQLRFDCMNTVATLLQYAGPVENPYQVFPTLLKLLTSTIRSPDESPEVRLEALRIVGIAGAVDPHSLEEAEEGSAVLVIEGAATNESNDVTQALLLELSKLIDPCNSAANTESLIRSAVSTLITIVDSCADAASKCHVCVPSIVAYLHAMPESPLRGTIVVQLTRVIEAAGSTVVPYLPELTELILKNCHGESQLVFMLLATGLTSAVKGDFTFATHFLTMVPTMMRLLDMPYQASREPMVNAILYFFLVAGNLLQPFAELIVRSLLVLLRSIDNMTTKTALIKTLAELSRELNFRLVAGAIIRIVLADLDALFTSTGQGSKNLAYATACVNLLIKLMGQLQGEYLKFVPLVTRVLNTHRISLQEYNISLDALLSKRIVQVSSQEDGGGFRLQLISVVNRAVEIQVEATASSPFEASSPTRRDSTSDCHLVIEERRVIERTTFTETFIREATKQDWIDWYNAFQIEILQQSPCKVLRCVSVHYSQQSLAQRAPGFVSQIFGMAFKVFWLKSSAHMKNLLVQMFNQILVVPDLPDEVMLPTLDLAEMLDCAGHPLPIPAKAFATIAESRGVLAKALRWKEAEYHINPIETVSDLNQLYGKLNLPDSAVGSPHDTGSSTLGYESLMQLGRFSEALEAMEREGVRVKSAIPRSSRDLKREFPRSRRRTLSQISEEGSPSFTTLTVVEKELAEDDQLTVKKVECLSATGDLEEVLAVWKLQYATAVKKPSAAHGSTLDVASPHVPASPSGVPRRLIRLGSVHSLHGAVASLSSTLQEDGEEEESLLSTLAPHAAEAAVCLNEWGILNQAVLCLPKATLNAFVYAAVLQIRNEQWGEALTSLQNGRRVLLDEVVNFLSESYNRAYEKIVEVQKLTELEEVISVLKLKDSYMMQRRLAVVNRLWDSRISLLSSQVRHWKRLLSTRGLLRNPRDDITNRIAFVELCREQQEPKMEKFTLGELLGSTNPTKQLLLDPNANPHVVLEYIKHLSANNLLFRDSEYGDEESLLNAFIERLTPCSQDEKGNSSTSKGAALANPEQGALLARFWARLASIDEGKAVERYAQATKYDPTWFRGWHYWANANAKLLKHRKSETIAINAITGYIKSISLGPRSSIFQDALRLLSVWAQFAWSDAVLSALEEQLDSISLHTWLLVIPQLVARLDYGSERSCLIVKGLMTRVGIDTPAAVLYPLIVCTASEGRRFHAASDILDEIERKHEREVEEATMIATELTRIADSLPHNAWWLAIEAAAKAWFWRKDGEEMCRIMLPLHDRIEHKEPQTMMEIEFKQRFGRCLYDARGWLKAFKENQQPACIEECWTLYDPVYKSLNAWRDKTSSLNLQYCSPKLFEARNLIVHVPSTTIGAVSFLPTLKVMKSKQRPCRFKILGVDGVEYAFLLKGGEDLRLDERVMQLFKLVNTVLAASTKTRTVTGYQIHRYSVTPVWTTVGVLGWVEGCDTLEELITKYREARKIKAEKEPHIEFQMLPHVLPVGSSDQSHETLSVIQKVEVLEYLFEHTSGHDIRKAMWITSGDSETWLQRRTSYTRSLATMSMTGYILGLGDRHPQNIMIQKTTGKVVHIDFGDCFEVAMKREKCPEKVPFRLTRMLCNAMEVSGVAGNFKHSAEAVMLTIRENRGSVLAMLEAFLYDPLISMRLTEPPKERNDTKVQDDGMQRAATVMLGTPSSPAALGETVVFEGGLDLVEVDRSVSSGDNNQGGISRDAYEIMKKLESKLKGREFLSGRRQSKFDLPPKVQVEKLIQQATDRTNLAQAYLGWHAFW